VASLGEDGTVRAGVIVPPLDALEDGRHQENRSRVLVPMLAWNVVGYLPWPAPTDTGKLVSIGLIVIQTRIEIRHFACEDVHLDAVPRPARR
jgi:hypothetical protein